MKLQFAHGVIQGMHYLHTRSPPAVHGDLTLNNILIAENYDPKVTWLSY